MVEVVVEIIVLPPELETLRMWSASCCTTCVLL